MPSFPENVIIDQIWSRSASLRWTLPKTNGNSPILYYIIQFWRDNSTSRTAHRLFEESVSSSINSLVLRDKLSPGTSYTLRVLAENEWGRSPASSSVHFTTQEEEPDAPPIDIYGESKGMSAIRLKWKAPPKNHWNGQLRGYYIGYKLVNDDEEDELNNQPNSRGIQQLYSFKEVQFAGISIDNFQQEYILTGLTRAATYSIILKAYNGAGSGPLSQQILVTTSNNG